MSTARFFRASAFVLAASLMTVSAWAQEAAKRAPVQEDPILRSIDDQPAEKDELALPTDADATKDRKVQEDPLLSGLNREPAKPERKQSEAVPQQKQAPIQADSQVERDPLLNAQRERDDNSGGEKPSAKRQRRDEREQKRDESQSDSDARLVPKPKQSAVQEDPLLRTVDPD